MSVDLMMSKKRQKKAHKEGFDKRVKSGVAERLHTREAVTTVKKKEQWGKGER